MSETNMKLLFAMKESELKELLEGRTACDFDGVRESLRGVHFNNDTVYASDGFRISKKKMKVNINDRFTIECESVKKLYSLLSYKKDRDVSLFISINSYHEKERTVSLLLDGKWYDLKLINEIFFDYEKCIPTLPNYRIEVKKNDFKKMVKLCIDTNFYCPKYCTLVFNEKCISIYNDVSTKYTYHTDIDVKYLGNNIEPIGSAVCLNPEFLLRALQSITSNEEFIHIAIYQNLNKSKIITPIALIPYKKSDIEVVLPIKVYNENALTQLMEKKVINNKIYLIMNTKEGQVHEGSHLNNIMAVSAHYDLSKAEEECEQLNIKARKKAKDINLQALLEHINEYCIPRKEKITQEALEDAITPIELFKDSNYYYIKEIECK